MPGKSKAVTKVHLIQWAPYQNKQNSPGIDTLTLNIL